MTRTVFRPDCELPQLLPASQGQEPGEGYCENYGGVLKLGP